MHRVNGLRLVEKTPSVLKSFPYFDHTGSRFDLSRINDKSGHELVLAILDHAVRS
jgi:hypothetical protein